MRRECGWYLKFFILLLHLTRRLHATSEADVLRAFKQNVADPTGVLSSWDTDLDSPCTWFHITCNSYNKVIRVNLGNSQLSGPLISDLGSLTSLQHLELYNNNISGEIPPELGNLSDLQSLDLSHNNLHGGIPESLGKLTQLYFLHLNDNSLTGPIPTLLTTIKKLQVLNISNNNLSGNVPVNGSFSWFTPMSFQGNANLSVPGVSGKCPGIKALAGGLAAAAIVFFVASAVVIALWRRYKRQELFVDIPAAEDSEVHLGQLKKFSLHEIQVATDGFNCKNVLGAGSFGIVYKGRLAGGTLVAVKRLKQAQRSGGELQFHTEVEMISLAVHRNLLRLRGFCMNHNEHLLVYSYMSKGSVASWLRERREGDSPLDWPTRKKIALGSARGLSYLHEYCDPKIIHRDIKAANILLDNEFEAVVGDFGLIKLMNYNDTHVTTEAKGTIGYIAPEYLSTGKASEKTDVFSYGILLLEIITGKQAFDIARISNDDGFLLIDWVMKFIREQRINMLVDSELQSNYDVDEVKKLLKIAQLCTQISPTERPRMSEVIRMLEGECLAERWAQWQRIEVVRSLAAEERTPFTVGPDWNIDSTDNMHPDELSGPR